MLKVALCDDDEIQIELMKNMMTYYNKTHKKAVAVRAFLSAEDLLKTLPSSGPFDVYILDVIMGGMNGIELAKELRRKGDPGNIIFLTSSMDYVLSAFTVRAFNYLLKPVEPVRLYEEIDILQDVLNQSQLPYVKVRTEQGDSRLAFRDISYIEFIGRAPQYHLVNGDLVRGQIQRHSFREVIEPFLAAGCFALCNVSVAVNMDKVKYFRNDVIQMADGTEFLCTRTMAADFRRHWNESRLHDSARA